MKLILRIAKCSGRLLPLPPLLSSSTHSSTVFTDESQANRAKFLFFYLEFNTRITTTIYGKKNDFKVDFSKLIKDANSKLTSECCARMISQREKNGMKFAYSDRFNLHFIWLIYAFDGRTHVNGTAFWVFTSFIWNDFETIVLTFCKSIQMEANFSFCLVWNDRRIYLYMCYDSTATNHITLSNNFHCCSRTYQHNNNSR